jgi:hypothetical protein
MERGKNMIIVEKLIKAVNSTASKSINTTSLGYFCQPELKVKTNKSKK